MFIAICMMVSFLSQSSQAAVPPMNTSIIHAFESTYSEAENTKWSEVGSMYKVDFTLRDASMFAFYNANGELVVTGKYLNLQQLPKAARNKLVAAAQGATIAELFQLYDEAGTKYYATISSQSGKTVLESTGGKWSTFTKSSK